MPLNDLAVRAVEVDEEAEVAVVEVVAEVVVKDSLPIDLEGKGSRVVRSEGLSRLEPELDVVLMRCSIFSSFPVMIVCIGLGRMGPGWHLTQMKKRLHKGIDFLNGID